MAQWRLFTERDFQQCERAFTALAPQHCWAEAGASVLASKDELRAGVARLRELTVQARGPTFEHGTDGKLPRTHVWRAYRLTEEDVVVAVTVLRNSQAFNTCEVDVFLALELPELEAGAAAGGLMLFLLSDAVKSGGSMAVQFTRRCAGGRVPRALEELAARVGVRLAYVDRGSISPDEARQLYLALTALAPAAKTRAQALDAQGLCSSERICYLVHHGVWSAEEVEMLLVGAPHPELVLGVGAEAEERHLHRQGAFHARAAVLGGVLARAITFPELPALPDASDASVHEPALALPAITSTFDPVAYARSYRTDEGALTLGGWDAEGAPFTLAPDATLLALLRARSLGELRARLGGDLERAAVLVGEGRRVAVVVPFDFFMLPAAESDAFVRAAHDRGVALLVCPEKLAALDSEVQRRFQLAKLVRR